MRRRLDAVLLLDKPPGISSNAALQQARRLYGARKAGHAGTLDPLATGLLVVLFGEAAKFSQWLLDADKEYLAEVCLGVTTSTGDAEGEVLERRLVDADSGAIEAALASLRGAIEQVPPMHSALKHGGRPLYELARRGAELERSPRRVTIHELQWLSREGDVLRLRIRCSKGTYVRRLAEDLGAALSTGAHLCGLRRTAAGGFTLRDACSLEALQAMQESERELRLLPVDAMLGGLPRIDLDEARERAFVHGRPVAAQAPAAAGRCRVYGAGGTFLGIGERSGSGEIRPRRLLASG